MKKALLLAALTAALPAAHAAVELGTLKIQSKAGGPLRAEILLGYDHPDELQGLMAGIASKSAQAGGAKKEWEKTLSFALVERNGAHYLVVESVKPLAERAIEVTVGVENRDGKVFRDYMLAATPNGWKVDSGSSLVAAARPQAPAPAAQQPGDIPLKASKELHHVLPFPVGQVALTSPKSVKNLRNLAEVSRSASRIQIKGWAGKQGSDEKRLQMAFSRAYFVKSALIQGGVSPDVVKIMRPELALTMLDRDADTTPRVVATLLQDDAPRAEAESILRGVEAIALAPVGGAPSSAVPLQLARALELRRY